MEPSEPTHYEHHNENYASIAADAGDIFAFIDDHTRLASHMNKSSWMMGGSVRRLGRTFDEVIIEYPAPLLKVWETVGQPKLLVIGHYRMTVQAEVSRRNDSSTPALAQEPDNSVVPR